MGKNAATVVDRDEYAMDTEAVERETKRGPSYWRPKDGENKIRILFLKGTGRYYREATQHFNVGPDNHSCFCPGEMLQQPCAVCEEVRSLRQSDDPDDREIAKDMRAKAQWFSAIVDLAAPDKGVQVWPYGIQVMKQLRNYALDPDYGNVFHPTKGRDFKVLKEKTGPDKTNVAYTAIAGPNPRPIANMDWMDDALEIIDGVVKWEEQETVAAWLAGQQFAGADEEVAPAVAASLSRAMKAPKAVVTNAATEAQVKAIYAIGRGSQAMTTEDIDEYCVETYGLTPSQLSRRQASELIDTLKLGPVIGGHQAAAEEPDEEEEEAAAVGEEDEEEPVDEEPEEEDEEGYAQEPVVPAPPKQSRKPVAAVPAVSGKVPSAASARLQERLANLQNRSRKAS